MKYEPTPSNSRALQLLSVALAAAGGLLLYLYPGHPIPYQPATSLMDPYGDTAPDSSLFDFAESQAAAARSIELGNQALAENRPGEAIAHFREAQRIFNFLPGIWEGLARGYTDLGERELAAEAILAARLNPMPNLGFPAPRGNSRTPDADDVTQELGLDTCSHLRKENEAYDLASPGVALVHLDDDTWPELICLRGPDLPTILFRGGPHGFEPVTGSGLEWQTASQGVYVADINHDARPDVLITGIGESRFYLNQGRLRFRQSTFAFPPIWASAAALADVTGNGHIDLVIGGWIGKEIWQNFNDTGQLPPIRSSTHVQSPNADTPYHLLNVRVNIGEKIRVYEGDGAGGFTDITHRTGIDVEATNLNLELLDFNHDRQLDLLVINDSMPNRLFLGQGAGRFTDATTAARLLDLRAGMGLAVADFDGLHGWDFAVTHFRGEMNALYMNRGLQRTVPEFADRALEAGFGVPGLPYVGWATFAWDYDADGWEDLLVVNGHMREAKHPPQLFRNVRGRFQDVSETLPPAWALALRARGAALADLNDDGFDDLVIAQSNDKIKALRMTARHGNHWLRVRVTVPDVDALGGVIELTDGSGRIQRRPVRTGSAFFSTQPREYYFGLGSELPARLSWSGRTKTVLCENLSNVRRITLSSNGCKSN